MTSTERWKWKLLMLMLLRLDKGTHQQVGSRANSLSHYHQSSHNHHHNQWQTRWLCCATDMTMNGTQQKRELRWMKSSLLDDITKHEMCHIFHIRGVNATRDTIPSKPSSLCDTSDHDKNKNWHCVYERCRGWLPVEVELGNYDFFKSAPSN